jgi:hypothetical protein
MYVAVQTTDARVFAKGFQEQVPENVLAHNEEGLVDRFTHHTE